MYFLLLHRYLLLTNKLFMKKTTIKEILRKSLTTHIKEESEGTKKHHKEKYDKDYSEVQSKLQDTMLKQSQVMAAAGLGNPKDATDRSLFSKKVRKDTNDEGGQYLFDDKELASVIKVLSNPAAFLSVKK
jgi:hypothetical protein